MIKIKSFEDLDSALLELGKLTASFTKKEADMNEELQKVTERFTEDTAELSGQIASYEDAIEKFCKEHKAEFTETRSKALNHGTVGFRTNPPKVVQLNKKWKTESSLAFLKKLFGKKYTREKLEIDKAAILADYAAEKLSDEDLAGAGLRVDQDETFSAEPNWIELKSVKAA